MPTRFLLVWLLILSLALPATAQLPQADQAFARHNYAEALGFYRQALKNTSQKSAQAVLHLQILKTLEKLKRYDDFLAELTLSLAAVPADQEPLVRARILHLAAQTYLSMPHQGFKRDGRVFRDQERRDGEYTWLYEADRQQSQTAFNQARMLYQSLLGKATPDSLLREVMAFNLDLSASWLTQFWIPAEPKDWPRLENYQRFPVSWQPEATVLEKIWRLYQENLLLARQLKDSHAEALERYRWARILLQSRGETAGSYPDQDPLQLLQALIRDFPADPLLPEVRLLMGDVYNRRDQYSSALEVWQMLLQSPLKDHAAARIQDLTWPQLSLNSPGAQAANTAARFGIQGRNLESVRFELYRVPFEKVLQDPVNLYRPNQNFRDFVANLGGSFQEFGQVIEKIQEWTYTPKPEKAYASFSENLNLPKSLPAGTYLLEAHTAKVRAAQLVVLSDVIMTSRQDARKVIYFLADAVTGKPVADARIYIKETTGYSPHQEVRAYRAQTDAQGMYTFYSQKQTTESHYYEAFAVSKDHYAFSNLGYWYNYQHQDNFWKIYAYTDRPLYRPGQQVNFRQLLRLYKDGKYQNIPENAPAVQVSVTNPRGEEVYKQILKANRFGSLNGQLTLPANAPLGSYSFQFRYPDSGSSFAAMGGTSFQVEEYKKPEYEVKVLPQATLPGETAHVSVQADYFFGGPVAGAQVQYTVSRQTYWPYWSYGEFEDYAFAPRPRPNQQVVLQRTGTLDAKGRLEISFPTLVSEDSAYTISAQVTDASRREVGSNGSLIVTRQGFFAHIQLDQGFYQPQDRVSAEIQLQDPNRRPVARQPGMVTIERIKSQHDKQLETEIVYNQPATSDDKGLIFVRWQSSSGGKYRVHFTARDKREQLVESLQEFWVAGAGFNGNAIHLNGVELITDKRSYAPGENVELLIQTDKPDSHVWLTQETDDAILKSDLLAIKGRSLIQKFTLNDQHQPNFMLRAMTVADRALHRDERELFVPALQHKLQISLTPDKASYAPGSSGKLRIAVKDATGKPVQSELSLALVDASLYQLLPDNTPSVHEALYGARRSIPQRLDSSLNVGFSNYVDYLVKQKDYDLNNPFTLLPGESGGGRYFREESVARPAPAAMSESDGFADQAPGLKQKEAGQSPPEAPEPQTPPRVRSEFKDTAYWNPAIVTDTQGLAELKLDFPDNLTTWRMLSRGWNLAAQVGQAQTEVQTRQDLMLRLQHPRFLTERDEVVVSANLNSDMSQAETVTVKLQLDPTRLAATGPLEQKATVPAKGQTRVDWRLKVLAPGETTLSAEVRGPHAGDAMRESLPVQLYGSLRTETHSGSTQTAAQEVLKLPVQRKPEQTRLSIRLQPSLAATLLDALPYLAEYPYGCNEQTTSRFVPAVLVAKTLSDLGIRLEDLGQQMDVSQRTGKQPLASRQELQDMIDEGLRRLTNSQNSDGGWGWWSGGKSDSYMSTYVLDAMQMAVAADLKVEPQLISHGLDYLQQQFKNTSELNLKTYQAYVLARGKRIQATDFKKIFEQRDSLNAYSKALLAMASYYGGAPEQARLILQNLKSFVRRDAASATASWDNISSWWYWYGDRVETNAVILQAYNLIAPADPLVPEIMRWLVYNRDGNRWHSTKDTARAIYALSGYLRNSKELKADYTVAVKLNGKLVEQVRFTPDKALAGAHTLTLNDKDLVVGDNHIELSKTGQGTLYYSTALQVFNREDNIPAAGNRLEVKRSYFKVVDQLDPATQKLNPLRTPLTEGAFLTSGDEVEVRLEIKSPNDYEYLLFEDFKPAGFETVDTLSGYVYQNGTGIYRELRDNRVAMFLSWMPQGTQVLSYRLRAETPGIFHALPHRAEAMYAPQIQATSDSMTLGIKD